MLCSFLVNKFQSPFFFFFHENVEAICTCQHSSRVTSVSSSPFCENLTSPMSSPQRGKAGSISSPSGAKGGSAPSSPTGKGGGAPSSPTGGKGALGSPSGVKSAQQTFQRVLPPQHARYQVVLLPSFIHQRYRLHTLSLSDLLIPRSLNRSVPPFPSSPPPPYSLSFTS